MENEPTCQHLQQITTIIQPKDDVCEECVKIGSDWMHLRTCQTCGVTLCCDSSPNTHMTKHFHATGHPVVISAEAGERWLWCYVDEEMAEVEM